MISLLLAPNFAGHCQKRLRAIPRPAGDASPTLAVGATSEMALPTGADNSLEYKRTLANPPSESELDKMRILIVGAGVVGANLAEELSRSGHDVSIIDERPSVIRRINDRMDVLALLGSGAQPSLLRKAGIEDTEMVIAVTNVDEVNLVICMLANEYGVKHKIARLRNDEYGGPNAPLVPVDLGIDTMINPESIITHTLKRILETPGANDVATFADGQVQMATFRICEDAPLAGKKLAELREESKLHSFLVVAIFRDEVPLIPRGDDVIKAGDNIAVLTKAETLKMLLPLVQKTVVPNQRIVIFGATLVGRRLAAALQHQLERVIMIEPDRDLAERTAADLDNTMVLNGMASDPDVLADADISHCDYFLALSQDDEDNLLAALMARRGQARQVAVLSQEPHYVPVLNNIGMDVVLNPRLLTVGEIMRHVHRGQIHIERRLRQSEAEVIELEPAPGAKVTNRPLKDLDFPDGSIIGAVIRDNEMMIPDGNCQIRAGETVVVFALPDAIKRIERLFARRRLLG